MKSEAKHILGDPLSAVTRRERRLLLIVSLVAYAIVRTGAVPQKIALLGIDFAQTDQRAFLWILTVMVVYFLVAFTIYGIADVLAWWHASLNMRIKNIQELHAANRQSTLNNLDRSGVISEEIHDRFSKLSAKSAIQRFYLGKVTKPVAFLRAGLEFILPVVFGIIVVAALITTQANIETKPNKAVGATTGSAPSAPPVSPHR